MDLDQSWLISKINPTSHTYLCKTNNRTHMGQFLGGKRGWAGSGRGVELPPQGRRIPPACPSSVTSHQGPSTAAYYYYRCGSRAPRKLPLLGGHDGQQDGVCQQGRSGKKISPPRAVGIMLTIAKALGRKGSGRDCAATAALSRASGSARACVRELDLEPIGSSSELVTRAEGSSQAAGMSHLCR